MNKEALQIGSKEMQKHSEPDLILYFAGIKDDSRKLSGMKTALEGRFPGKVKILPSIISGDFPAPRKTKLVEEIEDRLNNNEEIELLCHSLGIIEAARIYKKISPHVLRNHMSQLHLTLISPAGLFRNFFGFPDFMARFITNSSTRDQFFPSVLRGLESLEIYPSIYLKQKADVLEKYFPGISISEEVGNISKKTDELLLSGEAILKLQKVDFLLFQAIGSLEFDENAVNQISTLLKERGKILLPYIVYGNGNILDRTFEQNHPLLQNILERIRMIGRLMLGEGFQQLQRARELGVDIRFVHLGIDPIVTQQDIVHFFGKKYSWQQLIDLEKVISIEGWGHATHTLLPEELVERLYG